jgi:hypothetical protein
MTTILRCLTALLLAGVLLGADAPPPLLPSAEYPRLVESSVGLIESALAGEPTRRSAEKARVAAVMLAEFAQQDLRGPDARQRATVRDAALQLAALIKDKKYAEAVAQAKRLPSLPPNAAARLERIKLLGPHLDVEELMSQFRTTRLGGLGIEALLDELAVSKDGKVPTEALTDELRRLAYRTALAAELARDHLPKENPNEWQTRLGEMRKSAVELAEAAKAKDGKAAFTAVERLNSSCNKCHLKFRN